jgi:hypothetical protein
LQDQPLFDPDAALTSQSPSPQPVNRRRVRRRQAFSKAIASAWIARLAAART